MKRILHIGLSKHLGGIETYLLKLMKNINKTEFHFDFLITENKEDICFYKEFESLGANFYSITPRRKSYRKHKKDLKDLFQTTEIDIVHCHMNTLSNILPIKIALKYGKKVIIHSRNGELSSNFKLKTRFLHHMNYLFLPRKETKLLAVSDVAGKWMFGENAKFTVINNGIEINKFRFNLDARIKIRKELNIPNEYLVVIHVGAFRKQKNHMFLLEIFAELVKKNPDSVLILVGSGRLKQDIEAKANELKIFDKVIMVGNKTNVSDYLSAADVFLFPSYFEGFPNAVLEAQTNGLACLISDSITDQVIVNYNCYKLSIDKTPCEWAEKLMRIPHFDNREDGVKNIIKKDLSVKEEIKKIEAIYNSL